MTRTTTSSGSGSGSGSYRRPALLPIHISPFLLLLLVLICLLAWGVTPAAAFGAGNIPSFSHMEGRAFRHGDIEDILAELSKSGGSKMFGKLLASKFGGLDIKRIYFGNWLRDYSQAMDVASLAKVSRQTIINLCMALGFLAHGYATSEFEVTEDRLGVYLPVEHIDNPKGYNDGKDARQVHPKLRPPVEDVEMEIDPRTGMKNYIANDTGHWDTSSKHLKRVFRDCVEIGRRARQGGRNEDLYEAYRLLGTGLHTLEDFTAHSNYCELALRRLGYNQVFCHVGDAVLVQSPTGERVPPLITGSFGGADFIHSLLGEASDHISEASVSDLNKALDNARSANARGGGNDLSSLLFQLPGGAGGGMSRDMNDVQALGNPTRDPAEMTPQELHEVLWKVLKFRDDLMKKIELTIEKIPGLSALVERLTDAINRFVFTTLEPYLKPLMQSATGTLQTSSAQVIDSHDQFEVFNNPHASDPTHSFLSKDHFNLILNEPAGQCARIIVKHAVLSITRAWDDNSINVDQTTAELLEAFHHPYFRNNNSIVQREMIDHMKKWIETNPDRDYILHALTKDSVRVNKNMRKGHQEAGHGQGGQYNSFLPTPQQLGAKIQGQAGQAWNQAAGHIPGYNQYGPQVANQWNNAWNPQTGRSVEESTYEMPGMPQARPVGYSSPPPGGDFNSSHSSGPSGFPEPGFPEPNIGGGGGGYGGGYPPHHQNSYGGSPGPGGFPAPSGPPPQNEGYNTPWGAPQDQNQNQNQWGSGGGSYGPGTGSGYGPGTGSGYGPSYNQNQGGW